MQANWLLDKCSICSADAIAFSAHSGTHFRHDAASSKWHWSRGGSSPLYFASSERFTGALHVVEGESDTHALHAAGFRAIGVLGSSSLRKAFDAARECGALSLDDEVIVWREPGAGGDQFVKQAREYCAANGIALRIASYPIDASDMRELLTSIAEANRVRLTPDDGFGGVHSFLKLCAALPNDDRLARVREAFRERVNDLARDAIHAGVARESVIDIATAQPVIDLEVPAGWRVSQRLGVEIDAGERGFVRVIPVLLTIDCVEVDSHDASERLRLRWQARGRDFQVSVAREVVANTRRIVDLAAHGLPITSENARGVVRWLFELETLNELPRVSVARRSGWVRGELICSIDDLAIDDDSGSGRLLSGLHPAGHELVQEEFLRRVLTHHPMASVMLAASLSAALLRPLRLRGFALHLWGDSRGGKTAALKLAMSLWGDPIKLMGSWSATSNAIEAHAATLCDLPTALDELQAAKSVEHVAQTIYSLANGVGRARATVTGDLGTQRQWRTVVLTTGEMPLLPDDAHDGARTRTIDIHAAPFVGESAAADAALAHDISERHHGRIGLEFARQPLLSPANLVRLRDDFESTVSALSEKISGDIPPIKLRSAACLVMTLDWLRTRVNASDAPQAIDVIAAMMSVANKQADEDDSYGSMAWKVSQQILVLIASRRNDFTNDARERLGALDMADAGELQHSSTAWLTVPAMKLVCERAGVPYRRALEVLHEAGVTSNRLAVVTSGVLSVPTRLFEVSIDRAKEVER